MLRLQLNHDDDEDDDDDDDDNINDDDVQKLQSFVDEAARSSFIPADSATQPSDIKSPTGNIDSLSDHGWDRIYNNV